MNNTQHQSTLFLKFVLYSLVFIVISACEPRDSKQTNTSTNTLTINDESEIYIATNQVWQQGLSILKALQDQANKFKNTSDLFLNQPSNETLLATVNEWTKTQTLYEQLYPFLSIENESIIPSLFSWKNRLAPQPIMAGYLDNFDVYENSGIVNDISFGITAESIIQQHQLTDSEEVALGLYAIDFILLGDKKNSAEIRFTKQEALPKELADTDLNLVELPNNRRRHLLRIQIDILVNDLKKLSTEWQTNGELHRLFFQLKPEERLRGYYDGFLSTLNDIHQHLPSILDSISTAKESEINHFQRRYHQQALNSMEQRLTIIDEICCKEIMEDEELKKNLLNSKTRLRFSDILAEQDKINLLVKIYDIKKRLNKN